VCRLILPGRLFLKIFVKVVVEILVEALEHVFRVFRG